MLVPIAGSYVVAVIFMRHVFICIYYCSAPASALAPKTYNLFAGEMLHAAREMRIY